MLWVRNRVEWVRWLRRYITLLFAGLAIYVVYPMAPPWMAARDGYLPEVHRITRRGWSQLELYGVDLHRQTMIMWGMGNKVAAMPSLHCGIACLVALYGISRLRTSPRWSALRWLLLLYPLAMALALTYFAEHYVIDAICGCALAGLVMVGVGRWERRRAASCDAQARCAIGYGVARRWVKASRCGVELSRNRSHPGGLHVPR